MGKERPVRRFHLASNDSVSHRSGKELETGGRKDGVKYCLSSWRKPAGLVANVYREPVSKRSERKIHLCLRKKRRNQIDQRGARTLSCTQVPWGVSKIYRQRVSCRVSQAAEAWGDTQVHSYAREEWSEGQSQVTAPWLFPTPWPWMCSCVLWIFQESSCPTKWLPTSEAANAEA